MDGIKNIVFSYQGNGTRKKQTSMLDAITSEVITKNISKKETIEAICQGLLQNQYQSGVPRRRDLYCKNLAINAWKRIEWRLKNDTTH